MADATTGRKGGAVLFSEMTPPADSEARFNDWYDNHHMPSHVYGVAGFHSAIRMPAFRTIWRFTIWKRRKP